VEDYSTTQERENSVSTAYRHKIRERGKAKGRKTTFALFGPTTINSPVVLKKRESVGLLLFVKKNFQEERKLGELKTARQGEEGRSFILFGRIKGGKRSSAIMCREWDDSKQRTGGG